MSWIEKTDEYFRSLRLWDLKIDECYLNITSNTDIFVYGLSDECDRCPYTKMANITPENGVIKINTAERLAFKFFTKNKGKYVFDNNVTDLLCNEKPSLGEFGVYDIDTKSCQFKTALEPVNVNLCKTIPYSVLFFTVKLTNLLFSIPDCHSINTCHNCHL